MIYYATVHWNSDAWIDIQLSMLRKYTGNPYRVFAFLNGIDRKYYPRFDKVLDARERKHDVKLDRLAEAIMKEAEDSDWLIFIDGDAYPLQPVEEVLAPLLDDYPMVAIRRPENLGERQPHPSFCATTVGFWKQIKGTWAKGYQWINAMGNPDTDVGGELLGILERNNVTWCPLLRSNRINRHPVLFGVYAHFIYHHGAGFRAGASRQGYYDAGLYTIYKRWDARILNNIVPRRFLSRMRASLIHPEGRRKRRVHRALAAVKDEIFARIQSDPESVKQLFLSDEHDLA